MFGRIIMRVRHALAYVLAILGAIVLIPGFLIYGMVYVLDGFGTTGDFFVLIRDKVTKICSSYDEIES